ncbi:uncharacterized protein LOC143281331 [Babylonia areolata]|uniref:uncharacterized protein LOC143281331 n=1 Tax=Babylonia areolata TaxID=304850 RepID=UPI003FD20992
MMEKEIHSENSGDGSGGGGGGGSGGDGPNRQASVLSDEVFFHLLQQFPNLMLHDFTGTASTARLQTMLTTCEQVKERRSGWEGARDDDNDDDKDAQPPEPNYNFEVLLYWHLGLTERAEETARQEQRARPTDLIACTSLAFMLRQRGDLAGAEQRLRELRELRENDPERYSGQELESQHQMLYMYRKFFHEVPPTKLMGQLDALLSKRPEDSGMKIGVALILRRTTNVSYRARYPRWDYTSALHKAIELYAEVKDDTAASPNKRAVAAAELGVIFAFNSDDDLRSVADSQMQRLGLDAAGCFEEALTICPTCPAALQRAGKFFSYSDLARSKELLEKAVSMRPEMKVHHNLGHTLRKMAYAEKEKWHKTVRSQSPSQRLGNRAAYCWTPRTTKAWDRNLPQQEKKYPLSRGDKYVEDAIRHFKAAVDLTHGGNLMAINMLVQLHRELGEFEEALMYMMSILDRFPAPHAQTQTMIDLRLLYNAVISTENDRKRKNALYDQKNSVVKMAVNNQCQILKHQTGTFATPLKNLLSVAALADSAASEKSPLFDCMKYITREPLFRDMRSFTEAQVSDACFVERAVGELFSKRRHEDAVLLMNLVTVTEQSHMMNAWKDADLYAKCCVLAGCDRLRACPVSGVERSLAKPFFRQAFQDRFPSSSRRHGNKSNHTGNRDSPVKTPGKSSTPGSEASTPVSAQDSRGGEELEDEAGRAWQVQVLHDRRHTESQAHADAATRVLRDVCGLTVRTETPRPRSQAVKQAHVLLFLVTQTDITPEYAELIEKATSDSSSTTTTTTTTRPTAHNNSAADAPRPAASAPTSASERPPHDPPRDRVVALRLNGCPLPSGLRGRRSFGCSPMSLRLAGEEPGSVDGSEAVCDLFCSVLGVQM